MYIYQVTKYATEMRAVLSRAYILPQTSIERHSDFPFVFKTCAIFLLFSNVKVKQTKMGRKVLPTVFTPTKKVIGHKNTPDRWF